MMKLKSLGSEICSWLGSVRYKIHRSCVFNEKHYWVVYALITNKSTPTYNLILKSGNHLFLFFVQFFTCWWKTEPKMIFHRLYLYFPVHIVFSLSQRKNFWLVINSPLFLYSIMNINDFNLHSKYLRCPLVFCLLKDTEVFFSYNQRPLRH